MNFRRFSCWWNADVLFGNKRQGCPQCMIRGYVTESLSACLCKCSDGLFPSLSGRKKSVMWLISCWMKNYTERSVLLKCLHGQNIDNRLKQQMVPTHVSKKFRINSLGFELQDLNYIDFNDPITSPG